MAEILKIKKLFLLFFFSFLSLFFSLSSYYRPEISISDWRNGLYGSIYPMVTLDGNLSNPLDQKLHTLLGHHQYISPITTIIYISHSFTQPRTFHNQHNNILHTTYHIQQSNYIHQQPICSITWSCRSHAGSCRSHAGCHAVTCTLYPYLCCMWLCINHLIPDLSYFSFYDLTF